MAAFRENARKQLATLAAAEITAAQAVYPYLKSDLQGQSPVICFTSGGSERRPLTRGIKPASFEIGCVIFVLRVDSTSNWTEDLAESQLDVLEEAVADLVKAHNNNGNYWSSLEYAEKTTVDRIVSGGESYLMEVIPLSVGVFL